MNPGSCCWTSRSAAWIRSPGLRCSRSCSAFGAVPATRSLLVTHDVEEALFLANRVIVLSERPARVNAEVAVDIPHPRRRDGTEIVRLRQEILEILGFAA